MDLKITLISEACIVLNITYFLWNLRTVLKLKPSRPIPFFIKPWFRRITDLSFLDPGLRERRPTSFSKPWFRRRTYPLFLDHESFPPFFLFLPSSARLPLCSLRLSSFGNFPANFLSVKSSCKLWACSVIRSVLEIRIYRFRLNYLSFHHVVLTKMLTTYVQTSSSLHKLCILSSIEVIYFKQWSRFDKTFNLPRL